MQEIRKFSEENRTKKINVMHPHLVEDILQSLLCEGGALHILHSPQLLRQPLPHLQAQRLLLVLCWRGKSVVDTRRYLVVNFQ